MLSIVKMLLKGEVGGGALNSHGITLLIMENHGILFLNFCGNPALDSCTYMFNSFLASSNFCRLLISFANSLDSDQDRH